jgi:hypothetical protein
VTAGGAEGLVAVFVLNPLVFHEHESFALGAPWLVLPDGRSWQSGILYAISRLASPFGPTKFDMVTADYL